MYKRQTQTEYAGPALTSRQQVWWRVVVEDELGGMHASRPCLLYTSDAADERSSVDLGGRRVIKKKTKADMGGSEKSNTKRHREDIDLVEKVRTDAKRER